MSTQIAAKACILDAPEEAIDFQATDLLVGLIGEEHARTFRENHFQQHPVLFRNVAKENRLALVSECMLDFDIESLLETSASDGVQVWLASRTLSQPSDSNAPMDSVRVDHKQAYKLYLAGHSLYCRASSDLEASLTPKLLKSLGLGVSSNGNDCFSRGEIEMFYSRCGHVTDFHTDFQENFTVQLSGSKKWLFAPSSLTNPLRGVTPHFQTDSSSSSIPEQQLKMARLCDPSFCANSIPTHGTAAYEEVTLYAGDVLYHPAGVWHRVQSTEDSLSMNFSLTTATYADIFCSTLHQQLSANPLFRSRVLSDEAGHLKSLDVLAQLLKDIPSILTRLSPSGILPPCTTYAGNADFIVQNDVEDDENSSAVEVEAETIYCCGDDGMDLSTDESFRCNPAVVLLWENDLVPLGWIRSSRLESTIADSDDVCVVQGGFGNENFESVHRSLCLIPKRYTALVNAVCQKDGAISVSEIFAMHDTELSGKRKRHPSDLIKTELSRLVRLLTVVGVLIRQGERKL